MRRRFAMTCFFIVASLTVTLTGRMQCFGVDQAIHIRPDGLVDPSTAPIVTADNVTYCMTDDIYTTVSIERDNVVFNGANHSVQGTSAFGTNGIELNGRTNVTIMNVGIVEFWQGIYISESSHVIVNENLVTDHYNGMMIMSSSNCWIERNNVTSNYNDAIYFENCTNPMVLGNQIRGSDLTDHDYGITVNFSSNSTVRGNRIRDIEFGIGIQNSANNKVSENDVSTVNQYALWLASSANNTLWENNIMSNTIGVWLSSSSNNLFYNNNFVNNTFQVETGGTVSDWNGTYSIGGNYWSDYEGKDSSRGQFQNQPGSDGFGDSPYIIDEKNQDFYPLMNAVPEHISVAVATVFILSTLFLVVYRRRHSE